MFRGDWKIATIALGGTLSDEVDLATGYNTLFDTVVVNIPVIDSAQVNIQTAEEKGGTFFDAYLVEGNGTNCKIITNVGTGNFLWNIPLAGAQFIKIQTSAAQTGGARVFRICGIRT